MLLSIKVAHQGRFRRISLNRDELERTDALQRLKEALGLPISAQLQFRDLNAPKSLRVSDGKDLKEAAKCSLDGGSTVLRLEVPVSIEERSKILEDSFVYIPSPTRPSKARQASPPHG